MPVALFSAGVPSAFSATLPSACVSKRPARLPIRNSNGCGVPSSCARRLSVRSSWTGGKPLCRADGVEAELRGGELLIHVGDRDEIGAAAARVEVEAMVEELAERHQEQVGPVRVRRADRVAVCIEWLLADQSLISRGLGSGVMPSAEVDADRVGARLRCRLRLELSRRQGGGRAGPRFPR